MRVQAYLAIDIGAANTKCLVLTKEQCISKVVSLAASKVFFEGRTYFDIARIEEVVDDFITSYLPVSCADEVCMYFLCLTDQPIAVLDTNKISLLGAALVCLRLWVKR